MTGFTKYFVARQFNISVNIYLFSQVKCVIYGDIICDRKKKKQKQMLNETILIKLENYKVGENMQK